MCVTILVDRKLIENLLAAIANQKFIHELHPWQREEIQIAIDRVFGEGMKVLSENKKKEIL